MRYLAILIFLVGCVSSDAKPEVATKEYSAASSSDTDIDMEQVLKEGNQNLEKISELIKRLEAN